MRIRCEDFQLGTATLRRNACRCVHAQLIKDAVPYRRPDELMDHSAQLMRNYLVKHGALNKRQGTEPTMETRASPDTSQWSGPARIQ